MMDKMNEYKEMIDKEETGFYIVGGDSDYKKGFPWWLGIIIGVIVLAIIIFIFVKISGNHGVSETNVLQLPSEEEVAPANVWHNNTDASLPSCIIVSDTIIDSVNLKILTPYNVIPELQMGRVDTTDSGILFAALAADLRRDNGKIVGAFVHEGEPLSWGLSKKGYCAIFDDVITIGVADNSPLFEEATEEGGSFFRQYPSVDNGTMVRNNPKNRSFRRALCVLDGKICVVVSNNRVLMNDFSATLVKLGVKNAIFLVGGTEDGWYRTEDGLVHLGRKQVKNNQNINYLVFRVQ
ncbi:MAG: hypothetical protein J6S82_00230 [Bacteroidales bacterium]|nr:hypothetical protein [Bacteroidales bacterium]